MPLPLTSDLRLVDGLMPCRKETLAWVLVPLYNAWQKQRRWYCRMVVESPPIRDGSRCWKQIFPHLGMNSWTLVWVLDLGWQTKMVVEMAVVGVLMVMTRVMVVVGRCCHGISGWFW